VASKYEFLIKSLFQANGLVIIV